MSAVHDLNTGQEIDPFEAAYRRIRAQAEAANAEADSFGGPCDKCRHFRDGGWSSNRCMNPLVVTIGFDRADGKITTTGHRLSLGQAPQLCGDGRQLWEPRTAWQAFKAFSANWWGLYAFLAPIALALGLVAIVG